MTISAPRRAPVVSESPRARPPAKSSRRPAYAPGLDGLRALAVAAVVAYHAGVPHVGGGWIGVDVFFVVSGYLVTTLLQNEWERTERVRPAAFWLRRARRLLPALAVMAVVVTASAVVLRHDLNAGLRWQLTGAATYSSNWLQIVHGSSYTQAAEPLIFTHLWSLAVEEQFYLIWPPVLALLLRLVPRARLRRTLLVSLALISAGAMAVLFEAGSDPSRVYLGSDTHGFPLLLGAALALSRPQSVLTLPAATPRYRPVVVATLGGLGLIVVLAGMSLLDINGRWTYHGGLLVVDCAAVAVVAAAVRERGALAQLLGSRWLRPLGQRSYSLYLWHWPLLVICRRLLGPESNSTSVAVLAVLLSLVCTELSWRLVETPIRRHGVTGAARRAAMTLTGRWPTEPVRQRAAWGAVALLVVASAVTVIGVRAAPATSQLDSTLAAGEAALASASSRARAAVPVPPVTTVVGQSRAAPPARPAVPVSPSTSVPTTSAPTTSVPTTSVPTTSAQTTSAPAPAATSSPTAAGPRPTAPATSGKASATRPRSAVPVPAAPAGVGDGSRLTAIGDSVMLAAAPALLTRFPAADIDAVKSRELWDLPDLLGAQVSGNRLRPYLLIGLGTNGTEGPADILGTLQVVPAGEIVVLVNTYGPQPWRPEVNASLAVVATRRPHTCIADWAKSIAGHDDLLAPDDVHPGPTAGALYAQVVADALARCR